MLSLRQCLVGGYIAPLCLRALSKYWAATCKLNVYADNDPACMVACSQLVQQARNVQVPVASRYNMDFVGNLVLVVNQAHTHAPPPQILCANVGRLSGFVGVRGIKHLVLLTRNPQCSHLSSAIAGLEHLETLLLGHATGERLQQQTSGALQLAAHPSLQSLKLACIVPESISCSDSCELHVELGDIWSMEHPVWDTVLPHLRSVTLFGYSADLVAMPSMLLRADNLFKADLMAERCGMANAPLLLGGSLAHVEELILDCVELHAIVPARVTWRNVYVAATHLDLHFKDVASFGEVIPAFCFRFKELQVCYPQPPAYLWPSQSLLQPELLCYSIRGQKFWSWELLWQRGTQSGLEPCALMTTPPTPHTSP